MRKNHVMYSKRKMVLGILIFNIILTIAVKPDHWLKVFVLWIIAGAVIRSIYMLGRIIRNQERKSKEKL